MGPLGWEGLSRTEDNAAVPGNEPGKGGHNGDVWPHLLEDPQGVVKNGHGDAHNGEEHV